MRDYSNWGEQQNINTWEELMRPEVLRDSFGLKILQALAIRQGICTRVSTHTHETCT